MLYEVITRRGLGGMGARGYAGLPPTGRVRSLSLPVHLLRVLPGRREPDGFGQRGGEPEGRGYPSSRPEERREGIIAPRELGPDDRRSFGNRNNFV